MKKFPQEPQEDIPLRKAFKGDPFSHTLELSSLKSGNYLVEGEASPETWQALAERIALAGSEGSCRAKVLLTKEAAFLKAQGEIILKAQRECVRSNEIFMGEYIFHFSEELPLTEEVAENKNDIPESMFDVGDYLTQQIILFLPPYPISPKFSGEVGAFDIHDELTEKEKEARKNPFSALEGLKSKIK